MTRTATSLYMPNIPPNLLESGWRYDEDDWLVRTLREGEHHEPPTYMGFIYGGEVYVRNFEAASNFDRGQ